MVDTENPPGEGLVRDLKNFFTFLSAKLPVELVFSLCSYMMPDFIIEYQKWLFLGVPSSPQDIDTLQVLIQEANELYTALQTLGFYYIKPLETWIAALPQEWLEKCRNTVLDSVRDLLFQG